MIFIADGGSTKVDWRIIGNDSRVVHATTIGFNPFHYNSAEIQAELEKSFAKEYPVKEATKVFFYGSGCSDAYRCGIINSALQLAFPAAKIFVTHDLLGAARATCADQEGIVCILGTGANSGLFDGQKIIDTIPSLGYILGDEGSGAYLGKSLIRSYFYREMPADLKTEFETRYTLEKGELLGRLYEDPNVNVYLAGFTRFLSDHGHHPYVKELVSGAFREFIRHHIAKYEHFTKLPIHFVGSIALYFQDILKPVFEERKLKLGKITNKPIENLVAYHLRKENNIHK